MQSNKKDSCGKFVKIYKLHMYIPHVDNNITASSFKDATYQ